MTEREPVGDPQSIYIEAGASKKRSLQTDMVMRCVGCRWISAEKLQPGDREVPPEDRTDTYAYEIQQCTRLPSATVTRTLGRMAEVGICEQTDEIVNGRVRRLYSPATTEVGQRFYEALEEPYHCPLEGNTLDEL